MMMAMTEVIRVNFARPMPLFPLPDSVLLPHAVQPLRIFEPRYCQMVEDCLDSAGQIAMASFEGDSWKSEYHGTPPLRPAVCVGQIVHHESRGDGEHSILLHGVCRASIEELHEPDDEHDYRRARLLPLESVDTDPPPMLEVRDDLKKLLVGPRLSRMRSAETVKQWFDREDVSTHALLELIGFALVHDNEVRYQLLAEPSPERRANLIKRQLLRFDQLVQRADRQGAKRWPKGMSWN